jgi:hypothetical protein
MWQEDFRVLSVAEISFHGFLLDQILFLQESLEPRLVPHVVEELLGRELIASPPSTEDIPSPPAVGGGGRVAEACPVVTCASSPPSVRALVVIR